MTTHQGHDERDNEDIERSVVLARHALDRALSDENEIDLSWRTKEPGTRASAMAPNALAFLARVARQLRPAHVLQFGSGLSTALLLRESEALRPRFFLTTIEYDPQFARETVLQAGHHMLLDTFALSVAPLVGRDLAGTYCPVYDPSAIHPASPLPADLVLVDGPPGPLGGQFGSMVQAVAMSRAGTIVLLAEADRSAKRATLLSLTEKFADAIAVSQLAGLQGRMTAIIVRNPLPCIALVEQLDSAVEPLAGERLSGWPVRLTGCQSDVRRSSPLQDGSGEATETGGDTSQAPALSEVRFADLERYPRTLAVGGANAKTIEFLNSTSSRCIAEIGIYHGATTFQLAEFLNNEGELHLFDFEDRVEQVMSRLRDLGYTNAVGHGNSYKLLDSYNWSLMKMLQEHPEPIFDYVFIDGAHTWIHDALAFLLVDRLLKPGGYVDFDDYRWSLASSPSLRPERFPLTADLYTPEQIAARQVGLVVDLLVRRNSQFQEVVSNKIFRKLGVPSSFDPPADPSIRQS